MTINFNNKTSLKIDLKEESKVLKTPDWRRKKILNPATNKFVYEDSAIGKSLIKKERYDNFQSCKDGYKYDWRKDKCVKLSKKEIEEHEKNLRLKRYKSILKKRAEEADEIDGSFAVEQRCQEGQILNPITKKCVKIDSQAGRVALQINYEKQFWRFKQSEAERFG